MDWKGSVYAGFIHWINPAKRRKEEARTLPRYAALINISFNEIPRSIPVLVVDVE
jgi:hypothetical protein